ncbi:hypothetical protein Mapa_004079 [Marchantia paleacea]|nr:hypothetical protein Mapa_004079 [Marchantia paleacea]
MHVERKHSIRQKAKRTWAPTFPESTVPVSKKQQQKWSTALYLSCLQHGVKFVETCIHHRGRHLDALCFAHGFLAQSRGKKLLPTRRFSERTIAEAGRSLRSMLKRSRISRDKSR